MQHHGEINAGTPLTPVDRLKVIIDGLKTVPERYFLSESYMAPRVMAVSKTQDVSALRPMLEAGHRLFGENRVQEAAEKFTVLEKLYSGIELHLIGPLQRNKAETALLLFDVIETIDREKIALELARLFHDKSRVRTKQFFVQVNTGEEAQKAGISLRDADHFIEWCKTALNLPVKGVMCIPPVTEDAVLHFALLQAVAKRNGLEEISMGMSADFDLAAAMGSTVVRVGSALFGERIR